MFLSFRLMLCGIKSLSYRAKFAPGGFMAKYLLTGAAGFIGYSLATQLLKDGHEIVGVDNLNDYYDVKLKAHRITELNHHEHFQFLPIDIENLDALKPIFKHHQFDAILNLAARAGVQA